MLADNDTHYAGGLNGSYNFFFEDPRFISILKHKGSNYTTSIGEVIKVLEDWRSKYNISVVKECEKSEYCIGEFRDLILAYNNIHGYVSLLVCLFGSLANALNVAVLTRRDLAVTPINRLLKWLAVADVFVMLEYVPFAIYRYLLFPGQEERPYSWAVYMLFHMHFTQILHTASILLTLSLAVWRYIAIKYPTYSPALCTDRRCTIAILLSFVLPPILCIPSYFVFTIHKDFAFDKGGNMLSKVYFVDSNYNGSLYQLNFWVHAVLIKLLPCVILTVISAWLIRALYRANNRKKALKGYSACPANTVVNGNGNVFTRKPTKRSKAERRTDRTTKMLVAVLLLFLLTEFPQGILGLLSGVLGKCFFKQCYDLFGELMDALALLNGAINFVLYCSMSRQFRTTFGQMIRNRCAPTQRASSTTELQTTYPTYSPALCTDRRCTIAILLSFVLPPILCIPSYFVFTIHKDFAFDKGGNMLSKVYFVDSNYNGSLYQLNFWVHAVLIKLLPCVILTVISAWLIRALYRANNRKKALKGYSACPANTVVNGNGNVFTRKPTKRSKAERRTDRTTKMLVAVLLLFLLTEFRQGILGLLSGVLGKCFFKQCYDLFGELMDALALLNGAINFVLYCSMSRQFRTTFGQMIRNRCAPTQRASSTTELQTTYV